MYVSCSPGVRLAAHERSADALAVRGAPASARAHHVEQSARHGDAAAVIVLREAGAAAAQRAPWSARRLLTALRLLPETAPPEERAELLLALAGSWAATGRLEDSRAALLETLELAAPGDIAGRVKLISACAGVEQLLGRHAEAHKRLATALDQLPDDDSPEAAALMFELTVDAFYGMDYERMSDWGARTLETARALEDRPLMAAAAAITAFAGTLTPETVSAAKAHHAEAAALVDALSDDELAKQLNAVAWLGPAKVSGPLRAGDRSRRARPRRRSRNRPGRFLPNPRPGARQPAVHQRSPHGGHGAPGWRRGGGAAVGQSVGLAWSLLNRGFAGLLGGEAEEAVRASEEAVALTDGLDDSPVVAWSGAVFGYALLQSGDAERAHEVLVHRCGGDELPVFPAPGGPTGSRS